LVETQNISIQGELGNAFFDLTKDVDQDMENANLTRFTQNLTTFRQAVIKFIQPID
jgi:hypothetical protein